MIGKKGNSGGLMGQKGWGNSPLIGAAKNIVHGVGNALDSPYTQFAGSVIGGPLGAGIGLAKRSGVLEKLKHL